jgi:hypothetical protein
LFQLGKKRNGGEGGILATVISSISAFFSVDTLPVSSMVSAFVQDVYGSRAGIEDFERRILT